MSCFRKLLAALALTLAAVPVVSADSVEEVTYREHIRPLWENNCAACHGAASPYLGDFEEDKERYERELKGPRMDTYADLIFFVAWPDSSALMRRLDDGRNTANGKPGNMYQYLGASEEERQKNLALFKAWVGGDEAWIMKRPEEITKEELERFELAY
ncbi:cytochrome C [Thioalkalivibrio sulfidiphilus]|uniref:cytochrome C n=1 Tax=Thioalkalivibrio sulfidiphilus TaxID=1033854 RepID=UPI003B354F20